jgi:hypothetical protein
VHSSRPICQMSGGDSTASLTFSTYVQTLCVDWVLSRNVEMTFRKKSRGQTRTVGKTNKSKSRRNFTCTAHWNGPTSS